MIFTFTEFVRNVFTAALAVLIAALLAECIRSVLINHNNNKMGSPSPAASAVGVAGPSSKPCRVGIVGYGKLGEFLVEKIL